MIIYRIFYTPVNYNLFRTSIHLVNSISLQKMGDYINNFNG